mmetsp:Transcript_8894/g.10171  ORF Transcript_8894/g.10171 Transcript_8894/m.10171 type:complete len:157 (+) Transcript_8894:209-679(+)|eukprot:CAMPEP_0184018870 /NCGR_PEP_ID=MMETSP0954-20121128/8411_1 /TAXON_ID=627963 /ORGANISM="Aplanochytrium sp, Strain PBS07" /LENGTH=156 /DNA_ID=CAMNT_0026300423 /DNA_START=170 /DNA_END=640 /DNA_ORIENTATION=+
MSSSEVSGRERFHAFMESVEQQNKAEEECEQRLEENGYDSDDPEQWGPYYWSAEKENASLKGTDPSLKDKVVDNVKYYTFKASRSVNFAGDVVVHMLGLNQSKYQWMVDLVEREAQEQADAERHFQQREEMKRERRLQKEKAKFEKVSKTEEANKV